MVIFKPKDFSRNSNYIYFLKFKLMDQDCGFTISQIEDLANMLGTQDENMPQHEFGSALNPGTLHG